LIKMRQLNRDSLLVCVMLVSCCAAFAGIEETTGTLKSQPYKDKSGQKNKLSETQAMAREYREQGLAFQRQGDPVTALSFYQKAVELDPAYAVVYNDLGVVYEAMRFIDRAEESYLKAVKLDPEYLSAYTNLALLYENKRDLEKAESFWKKRAELGISDDPWTEKARARLKDIYSVLSANPAEDQREQEVVSFLSEVESKKSLLRGDKKALSKDYFEKARRLYQKGDALSAWKQASDASQLDPSNTEIKDFIDKLQERMLLSR